MGRLKVPSSNPKIKTPVRQEMINSNTNRIVNRSLVAAFDDLCKNGTIFQEHFDLKLISHIRASAEWRKKCKILLTENSRLQTDIIEKGKEISGKDYQIRQARKFLDEEQKCRKEAEAERDEIHAQLEAIKRLLLADGGRTLDNETLEHFKTIERIGSLRRNKKTYQNNQNIFDAPTTSTIKEYPNRSEAINTNVNPRMTMIQESTESLLDASELTFDETQGDALDGSRPFRSGKRRSSANITGKRSIVRKSAGEGTGIVAKTTVRVDQDGLAHAESFIETFDMDKDIQEKRKRTRKSRERRSTRGLAKTAQFQSDEANIIEDRNIHLPSAPTFNQINQQHYDIGLPPKTPTSVMTPVKRTFSNAASVPSRPHCFIQKSVKVTEKCNPCGKRIKFGKIFFKCQDCEIVCHKECRLQAPVPCIAGGNRTPTNKTGNYLADHASAAPPMIPAIIMCCVKDVEARGIDEVGIYRVPGNECHANEILDKFTKQNRLGGPPRFNKYDVHSVASCIKKFLRSLKEPIIPLSSLQNFVDAAYNQNSGEREAQLYQAISELPQPNRDTLAYLMIHLQTIAANHKVNKMDTENVAMVMGPSIVGYSSSDPTAVFSEIGQQQNIMQYLLALSSDYWSTFLAVVEENILGLNMGPTRIYKTNENKRIYRGYDPDYRLFSPPAASTDSLEYLDCDKNRHVANGAVARLARSRQANSKKSTMFQSPMI